MTYTTTYIVFDENTAQTKIDWHVSRVKPNLYYVGIPPKFEQIAEDESWTLPYVGTEIDVVPDEEELVTETVVP